ncbi:hypothetical protein G9A89_018049 [Geosiphon pyriformis]|nr:hypothetical protein G9A89_018049 [Geosiphon pyriformis]
MISSEEPLIESLTRKQNTVIGGMTLVSDWELINIIPKEKLREVQKFFESKPPKIQSLAIEQRESSFEEKKVDIENLLAKNNPVISKESNTFG